jgi:hypothetical protein
LLEKRHGCGRIAPLVHVQRGGLAQVGEPLRRLDRAPGLFLEQSGERAVVARLAVELAEALADGRRLEGAPLRRFEAGAGALAVAERRVRRRQSQ